MSDHAQLPVALQREVKTLVEQSRVRSGFPVRRTLAALEISPGSYYRWSHVLAPGGGASSDPGAGSRGSMYEVLESERRAIVEYALTHPEVRHRELAWSEGDQGGSLNTG